ncbi:MAG: TIM barrel protein [Acidobacteria bacterium]|nr:TIM barrel protein [Acidobacteriota bacterium]
MDVDRRALLKGLAAGLAGAVAVPARAGAHPLAAARRQQDAAPRWGVQLYTVRSQISADPAGTLKRIAAIGYRELEVMQATLPVVAPIAAELGLAIVSVHLDGPTARGEGFEAFLPEAKRLGIRDLVVPFVAPAERPADRAGFEAMAARLAAMARTASAAGLRLAYHNHAFEFGRDRDGTAWIDVLMKGTADARMLLQLDVFWATVAGADPVAVLRRYAGRVASLHLKDKDPHAATGLDESAVPPAAFVEVGSGAIDFPAVLAAARAAGVRHFFVEQDHTSGDPVASLAKSYAYLSRSR